MSVFVAGFGALYVLGWLMLMIATDAYFGHKALMYSFVSFFVALMYWGLVHTSIRTGDFAETVAEAVFLGAIVMVVSKIRELSGERGFELEKSREQERLERERLIALINSMGDAVINTNQDGIIRIFNAAALSLLDTNEDLTGKDIRSVLRLRDNNHKKVDLLQRIIDKPGSQIMTDLQHAFSKDELINLYINVSPIHLGYQHQGEHGYIFILRDITKEKSLEEERDEFISVVSHELRTPIAIAEGNLSNVMVLQDRGADKAMIANAVKGAHDQVLFLAKMANDLSTLSRAERGINTADIESLDVYSFLNNLHNSYAPQAKEKGLKLIVKTKSKMAPIMTNKLYVEEILQNFVTNSIKYTKTGSITISAQQASNKTITFVVQDTGIGISKSDQKHLFEKFFRSEDYRTRESSGTGLGLYLVRKLSQLLGAEIKVESRLNHGSKFSIVVRPVKETEQETPTIEPQS
jgi:PAS domain S-box-containing protein